MKRFLAILFCILTLAGVQDTAAKPPQSLFVDATVHGWQSTGVILKKNHSVVITASGEACFFAPIGCTDPAGNGDTLGLEGTPWLGGPAFALVAMAGGDMFFVGSGPTQVSGTGELFLPYNDDRTTDNSGGFNVSILSCRPGNGNGDQNHCHTGAPGQS